MKLRPERDRVALALGRSLTKDDLPRLRHRLRIGDAFYNF